MSKSDWKYVENTALEVLDLTLLTVPLVMIICVLSLLKFIVLGLSGIFSTVNHAVNK